MGGGEAAICWACRKCVFKFYSNAWKRSTFDWATGQWSCRSNDSTDASNGNHCILGYLINPQKQWLWGGLVRLRPWYTMCVCPEPALMIVGKLTWAIVNLKECMVSPITLQMGKRKPETLGGQMLRQKEVNYPIQLYLPLQEKKCGKQCFCAFYSTRRSANVILMWSKL